MAARSTPVPPDFAAYSDLPVAIVRLDANGRIVARNPGAERLGRHLADPLIPGERLTFAGSALLGTEGVECSCAGEDAVVVHLEVPGVETGSTVWLETRARRLPDGSGHDVVLVDVSAQRETAESERRELAQRLRERDLRLRAIADAMTDVFFSLDREMRFTFANAQAARWLGLDPDRVAGHGLLERLPQLSGTQVHEAYRWALETGMPFRMGHTSPARPGVFHEVSAYPIPDGIAVLVTDVTERMRAAETIASREARYRSLAESFGEPFCAIDEEGRITYWNHRLEDLTGVAAEAAMGRRLAEVKPSLASSAVTGCVESVLADRLPCTCVHEDHDADARRIYEVRVFPMPEGAALLAIDRTEQHASEEKLRHALEERETLLREIHHRVKNNLQIVASLLRIQLRGAREPSVVSVLGEAERRVQAMSLVHEQLYGSPDLAHVDARAYLGQLVRAAAVLSPSPDVTIDLEEGPPIVVELDAALKLGLVVSELAANALKHAFPAGRPGRLRLAIDLASVPEPQLVVRLEDDGVGLPTGIEPGRTPSLGLSLVPSLVRQMGGSLHVVRSGGTRYRIEIPHRPVERP